LLLDAIARLVDAEGRGQHSEDRSDKRFAAVAWKE
jgi:hypothetical protein